MELINNFKLIKNNGANKQKEANFIDYYKLSQSNNSFKDFSN